jgi:hypothetical protein
MICVGPRTGALNLSSSGAPQARPGDPVNMGAAFGYWVARSSRAMTAGTTHSQND